MAVLVTSRFDEDPIKNERASLGNFSDAQGQLTPVSGPIWSEFELV